MSTAVRATNEFRFRIRRDIIDLTIECDQERYSNCGASATLPPSGIELKRVSHERPWMRWRKDVVRGTRLVYRIGHARCAVPAARPLWDVLEGSGILFASEECEGRRP